MLLKVINFQVSSYIHFPFTVQIYLNCYRSLIK
uniref:Uncharacterized protein n=1 Tax=Amphimedon queenslandica TaxID=400682 RepID=A0A1X7SMA9_AMPQE